MKIRLLLLSFTLLAFSTISYAQKIQIKKGIVYVDSKECLRINGDANNVSFYDMDGNELFFMKYIHDSKYASLYNKITFINQKISFTSKNYIYTKKLLIKRLMDNFVLMNCELKEEKVENFVMKYDEDVEYDIVIIQKVEVEKENDNNNGFNLNININK